MKTLKEAYVYAMSQALNDLDNCPTTWGDADLINALYILNKVRDAIADSIMADDDEIMDSAWYDAQAMTREYATVEFLELIEVAQGGKCSAIIDCLKENWQYE